VQRIERLQKRLQDYQIDCFVVTKPINLFYLLGLDVSVGMLVVEQGLFTLYLDRRYTTAAEEKGYKVSDKPLKERFKHYSKVVIEGESVSYDQYLEFCQAYPSVEFVSKMVVEELRIIKDAQEIKLLRQAADHTVAAMRHVLESLREGITEEELAELVRSPSFSPIIAFGSNSAHVHHRPTKRKYQPEETVLVDLGVKKDYYMGDMTRTIHSLMIKQVKEAHDRVICAIKPGIALKELDQLVKTIIPLKDHSLGHGIGLEVHERYFYKTCGEGVLEPGMVITVEPGLYLPQVGGARYESMVLVTDTGSEILTGEDSFF
jgi:Xaa-Pro aminopeptidase